MIEKKPESFSDIVDRAVGELRSSPVPPELPPELLEALLQAAKENTGAVQCTVEASAQAEIIRPTFLTRSLTTWRWIMRSPVSRVAAAAIFVLAIAGVALWFHGRRHNAGLRRLRQADPRSKDRQVQDDRQMDEPYPRK